jgi:hypothetical protein
MKKICVLILSLFLAFPAYAGQKAQYKILSFEGGLNTQVSSWLIKENQSTTAQNIRFNKTYGAIANRNAMLSYGDCGSSAITSMHRYYNSSGTQALLTTGSTNMYVGNDNAGTFTTIEESLTDGKRWTWVTYQDVAIGCNGYDNNIKYDGKTTTTANTDGARTANALTAELGAPFAELDTGTDLDASSWYQYKVAFYDGSTYSYSTAKSNPILTGSSVHNIALTDIPLGPSGTTHRYIYRTLGNASKAAVEADTTYYLVGTLSDNSTTTFADDVDDTTAAGDSPPTWSTVSAGNDATPPTGKFCIIHDERLFVAGNTTNASYLYWSDEYNPDYFSLTDYEAIREDDGDEITFIRTLLGILIVGKENTIQKFYTDSTNDVNWYASDPMSFTGCPAPYSVSNSPLGILYLGRKGIYRFTGHASKLISDAITPEIEDISSSALDDVVGIYWKNEYQLAYTSTEVGGTKNDRVIVYDIIRNAYSLDHKNVNCFGTFNAGDDVGVLYSGSSDTDGTIYAHEGSNNIFRKRYKSEFDAGTADDVAITGTETAPELSIGWDCTIDTWLTELQTKDANISTLDDIVTYLPNATIDRPDTDGSWESPVYEINASSLVELYWTEELGLTGDITIQLRCSDDSSSMGSYGTEYTDPNGSDLSSETAAQYIQFKINLETTNSSYSPEISVRDGYLFKMTYLKQGSTYESDFTSVWESGWTDFGIPMLNKYLAKMIVHYTGDTGTLTISYWNARGDIDRSFDIDLSQEPFFEEDAGHKYEGTSDHKIYTYYFPYNSSTDAPIGQWWRFKTEYTGTDEYTVQRIEMVIEPQEYVD